MVYDDVLEDKIDQLSQRLSSAYPDMKNYRWHSIKLLEGDKEITEKYPWIPRILSPAAMKRI